MSSKKELTPSERIQINQREKLRGFMKGILDLFGKYMNTPFQIPNLLKQLTQTKEFNSFTERLGLRFVNEVKVWNEYAFKEYMKTSYAEKSRNIFLHLNKDDEFQKFIQKQAEERANLFKRIPVSLAEHLTPKISKWSIEGMTSKEVAHKLRADIPNLLESQVKTIARTETSKTLIAITGYKCQKNNIPCYQWKASGGYRGDGRTRNSHRHMSDVIIFWNDPPAPEDLFPTGYKNTLGHYHAGCCPNCRCSASPLVFIEDLKFPVRVYTNGKIVSMDRTSFLKLYNGKIAELKAEKRPKEQAKITQIKKSPEELAKEKKAKEEERFLNEQRAKVNRLASEINFYLKQINIIEESLQNQTDRKIIKAETEKINKYSRIIEKYKQELEKIRDSIVISNGSLVGDSLVKDFSFEYHKEEARIFQEEVDNEINNIPRSRRVKLPNGEITKLTEETYLTNVKIIAGKKCQTKRGIDIIDWLSNEYKDINADPKDWSKRKGKGFVDFRNKSKKAEIHWFEALGQRVELKVKRWLYES